MTRQSQLDLSQQLQEQGDMLKRMGQIPQALKCYQDSLIIKEKLAPKDLETSFIYHNIGSCFLQLNQPDKALEPLLKALSIKEKLAPEEPTTANTYNYIGQAYLRQGNTQEALKYNQKSLIIREREAANTPALSDSYAIMGQIAVTKNNFADAANWFQKSINILEVTKPSTPDDLAGFVKIAVYCNVRQGDIYHAENEFPKSTSYYQKALALTTKHQPKSLMHVNALSLIGKNSLSQNDLTNAFINTQNAIRAWETLPESEKQNQKLISAAIAYDTMAKIYQLKGKPEEEISNLFKKALAIEPTDTKTADARDFIYEQETKGFVKPSVAEKPGAKFVTISQNEEGVIRSTDAVYEGLMTYGLQTCCAVIISDKVKGVHILQHHDMFTDQTCILESISREKLTNPEVTLVYNATHKKDFKETKTIQDRVVALLEENHIRCNKPFLRTNNLDNVNGGVLITKNGEIDANYFLLEGFNLQTGNSFTLEKDFTPPFRCTHSKMHFEPSNYTQLTLSNDVAKATFFAEKRPPFLRYDGKTLNPNLPTLPPKMEHYFRTLFEEGYDEKRLRLQIAADREKGLFDLEGDKWYKNSDDVGKNFIRVFQNLPSIAKSGCLPPPGSIIDNTGKTVLVENVSQAKEAKRREKNSEDYKTARANRSFDSLVR